MACPAGEKGQRNGRVLMTVAYRDYPLTGREFFFRRNAFSNTLITGCVQCIGRISGLAVAYRPSVACRSGRESDLANGTRQARDHADREPGERGLARGGRTRLDQAHSGVTDDTRTELRFYPAGEWRNGRSEPIMVVSMGSL